MEAGASVDRRRRNLQVVLFLIILATLPFYCAGFVLLGTAPGVRGGTPTQPATTPPPLERTLATATRIAFPSITPLPGGGGGLLPTPGQFFPTVIFPTVVFPTLALPTATPFIFPTSTPAPTLTMPPTAVLPPTQTPSPIPIATDTPFVFASATPMPVPDSDGDGVADNLDLCPSIPGPPPSGCPPPTPTPSETVLPPGP